MGKFPFKRLRVISKKFPQIDSHVESVSKSLDGLVFSYQEKVEKALHKKHVLLAVSSLAVLVVVGSFISPSGRADNTVFYPKTCLGGWSNPHNAEGEGETSSNTDASQFSENNSSLLPKDVEAEIYCGNFTGKFDEATRPTKMIVSLAMTHKEEVLQEVYRATSIDSASSTNELNGYGTTSLFEDSSTTLLKDREYSSSLIDMSIATTSLPVPFGEEVRNVVEDIMNEAKEVIGSFFVGEKEKAGTDTVVIPVPETETPNKESVPPEEIKTQQGDEPATPVSLIKKSLQHFVSNVSGSLFTPVFAEEVKEVKGEELTPIEVKASEEPKIIPRVVETQEDQSFSDSASTSLDISPPLILDLVSTSSSLDIISSSTSSSSEPFVRSSAASSTYISEEQTQTVTQEENRFQNNFLEVFYTFDGNIWQSLGELNEISMKYRTFEIPVTASTTWTDMSQLQIKIQSKKYNNKSIPLTYLDSIKVDVIYETTVAHPHPDFTRDTILKDEEEGGVRILTIINNETKREEVWYMYLDTASSSTEISSSTEMVVATSSLSATSSSFEKLITPETSSTTSLSEEIASTSSSLIYGTSTSIRPVMPRMVWYKFEGKASGKSLSEIVLEIKIIDKERLEPPEVDRVPDFTKDTLISIRGAVDNSVVVQVTKMGISELWLYNLSLSTEEKINTGTSTVISSLFPIAIKDSYVFFMSGDETEIISYNITTKVTKRLSIPLYDGAEGERAEVVFEGFPWKIIVSPNNFSFFSEKTGELFSDENGALAEQFRNRMLLDSILNKDQLSDFNFQVDGSEESITNNEE